MPDWLSQLYTTDGLQALIASAGLILLIGIVFAETGLLLGFFLPGDSLLVTAGVLTAFGLKPNEPAPLDLWTTGLALSLAGIAGNQLNYHLGRFAGERVWSWRDGRLFKRRYLDEAREFYDRWGGLAVVGGRFIPIVRTFVPFVAGVARMPLRRYAMWNILGGVAWVWSLLVLGHVLGNWEIMRRNLHLLILCVVAVSFIPVAIGLLKRWRASHREDKPGAQASQRLGDASAADVGVPAAMRAAEDAKRGT